jgi:hypothetical protein
MMKFSSKLLASSAAILMLTVSVPAMADCMDTKGETAAGKKTDKIVAQTKTDPETGDREAATGGAQPNENWFGCKPGSDDQKCASQKGQQQESEAKDSAASGKAAEKPADPSAKNTTKPAKTTSSDSASGSSTAATSSQTATGDCVEDKKPG